MVIYVFDAKAVVAVAPGTISKLKIGMIDVRFATYCAFMAVVFFIDFALCLLCCFLEIHYLR